MAWSIISEQWNLDSVECCHRFQHSDSQEMISEFHRDRESGEALGSPERRFYFNTDVFDNHFPFYQRMTSPYLNHYHFSRPFRIKDALLRAEVYNQSTKGPENFGKKTGYRQVNAEMPQSSSETSWNPGPFPGHTGYTPRQEKDRSNSDTDVVINIWEEFRYGSAVLNRKCSIPMSHGGCEWARPIMADLLPKYIVDYILYVLFFVIYFVSCCFYNSYLDLGCVLLYDLHLRIHENADRHNLKVKFKGSAFQGPMYCIIRVLCHHCEHDESDKIVLKLMKKMKQDINDHLSAA